MGAYLYGELYEVGETKPLFIEKRDVGEAGFLVGVDGRLNCWLNCSWPSGSDESN